jgi:hypothetical protein
MLAKILPLVMTAESLLVAVFYVVQRDWRHAFYWFSSACIILSVTL